MAYNSDESGQPEVYVQPFPGPGGKWLISQGGGGFNAIWSRDGRRLFYRRGDQFLEVDVDARSGFAPGTPRVLFSGRYLRDGAGFRRFPGRLALRADAQRRPAQHREARVVLNWWHALEARTTTLPTSR